MKDNREVLRGSDPTDPTFELTPKQVTALESHGDYIVTCAQNNTEPEWGFLRALERCSVEEGDRLVVIPVRYKNPTSRRDPMEERDNKYWWHPAFRDHMVESELRLHRFLRVMAQVRIEAMSGNPVPGTMDGRSKAASAIYGHPQLTMRTVPTPQEKLPKFIYTTGAVTGANCSTTRRGDLAGFHHSNSAIRVKVRDGRFWLRELVWDGKRFIDLGREYTARTIRQAPPPEALYLGDVHGWFRDPAVHEGTWGPGGVVDTLRPRRVFVGDVSDFYSCSPWERGKKLTEALRAKVGMDFVEYELADARDYLNMAAEKVREVVVVPSNHDAFLHRWLEAGDRWVEPKNRELYHWLSWRYLQERGKVDPFALWCRDRGVTKNVKFLKVDESYQVKGVECGMHGHLGPNGARGSIRNLARIGTRSMIGHGHGPGIWQGAHQVGTASLLNMHYTAGPSGWFHTHGLVHANGYRQLLHMVDGIPWPG